ncbi:hypothetical protein BHM03_00020002 [Ensete ventricosum]|nr:hypothetical protein BHM03_00020002 [Ensete ventricosum]
MAAGPVEKQIDVIVGGLTSKGDSTSGHKAYAWAVVGKCPHKTSEPQISFKVGEVEYPNHNDELVISVCVANALVKRVMVDTSSSTHILYKDASRSSG